MIIYYPNISLNNNHIVMRICDNSKDVIENSVFVALDGYISSGKRHIDEAIARGAKSIILESLDGVNLIDGINYIVVKDVRVELARLLKWIHKDKKKPVIIGITGTNGKTTTSTLIYDFLKHLDKKVILLGTSGNFTYLETIETKYKTQNTTPDIRILYDFLDHDDIDYLVMEVSSEGIAKGRVLGIDFDIIAFTNITQDHLDYHKTIDNYAHAKAELIHYASDDAILVLNDEMNYYSYLKSKSLLKLFTYGKTESADFFGVIEERNVNQMMLSINDNKIITNLIGDFNLDNILLVYSILSILKFSSDKIIDFIKTIKPIKGRMNVFKLNKKYILIDFAHTPDGVEKVLDYVNKIKKGKVITVIGCGGNKDKIKRPLIGNIVTNKSDYAIFTSDNSRNEEFVSIINDIIKDLKVSNFEVIKSRMQAINEALLIAEDDDIICILGKGAEEYIIEKEIIPFSDIDYIEKLGGIKAYE